LRNNNKKQEIYENVEILEIVAEGKAIAKIKDLVIFATQVVPGDIVDLKIIKKKKNYREAIPTKFHKYSERRINVECTHFGTCGGCKWLNVSYEDQLKYKQKQIIDNLERIGKIELNDIQPILPSENVFNYRNKLEFTFSSVRWFEKIEALSETKTPQGLGFHIPGMFDKVVDVYKCFLQKEPSNEIRNAIRTFTLENNYDYYDHRRNTGYLRNIVVRSSITNDLMVIVIFNYEDVEKRENLMNFIANKFKEITSLFYIINTKSNDSYYDQTPILFKGNDHIIDTIGTLKFKISPKSFFQTNSEQAFNLYRVTKEFANLTGTEIVYDLYTGAGTIANFVADKALKVIGIEYIPEAIEDAKINSELNNIKNTVFYAGDMKNIFNQKFIYENGKPQVIILDPPRAGVDLPVLERIINADPQKIVYVSCNPATQARDVNILSPYYKVTKIQPVDMFPHTHHVENIVLLERI